MNKQKIMSLIQANRLDEARTLGKRYCKKHPDDAEALFVTGALCAQLGQFGEAEPYCKKVTRLQPGHAGAHYNFGIVLHNLGKFDQAVNSFQQAIRLKPDFVEAWCDLGNSQLATQHYDKAIKAFRQAITLRPGFANAHLQLGVATQCSGNPKGALDHYRYTLNLVPGNPGAQATDQGNRLLLGKIHFHTGNAEYEMNMPADAEASYRKAIEFDPEDFEAWNNLSNALQKQHKSPQAIEPLEQAIRVKPDYAQAYSNMGLLLRTSGQLNEALEYLTKAVRLDENLAECHHNLANVLFDLHRHSESEASYRKALQLQPNLADAEMGLGNTLLLQGRSQEAVEHFRTACRLSPGYMEPHSTLLFALNYLQDEAPGSVYAEHVEWGKRYGNVTPPVKHKNNLDPDRRLHIGYVSPDFCGHSVAFFLEPLLAAHDRKNVRISCYAEVAHPDEISQRLRTLADNWYDTPGMSDQELAELIRDDAVDILVDLAGHSRGNRLPAFAHKPAPVQITWLGYPNTTGMAAMDYRLSDDRADPPGTADNLCSEKLLRLPGSFLCYQPLRESPAVQSPPVLASGRLTFGSFNMLAKTTPTVVQHWAQILNSLPGSRLILKNKALQDADVRRHYHAAFAASGVEPERVELISWTPNIRDHLALYHRIDIALDPYPYNGTTTSCEALWMGVPVVTLAGNSHAGRVGVSLLHATGLQDLVADTPEDYTRIATALGSDPERLKGLRDRLREQIAASPLCDAVAFSHNIEIAYRKVWTDWCSSLF